LTKNTAKKTFIDSCNTTSYGSDAFMAPNTQHQITEAKRDNSMAEIFRRYYLLPLLYFQTLPGKCDMTQ